MEATKEITRWEYELYYWSRGTAGNFHTQLVKTYMAADTNNALRLLLAFPEELKPVHDYMHSPGYWEDLKKRIENR